MVTEVPHPAIGGDPAKLIASPLRLSATPVEYRHPPPVLGEHTVQVERGQPAPLGDRH